MMEATVGSPKASHTLVWVEFKVSTSLVISPTLRRPLLATKICSKCGRSIYRLWSLLSIVDGKWRQLLFCSWVPTKNQRLDVWRPGKVEVSTLE